jgi:glycosyltransferase involved in cell wall biosynthesis
LVNVSKPLVSVIIPAHNAAPWIRESVGSAIGQTHEALEVIVVDDGSADDTAIILAEFTHPRLNVVTQSRHGAAAARNTGLSVSKGQFIQFLDADDTLSSSKIELQLEALTHEPRDAVASCEWVHLVPRGVRTARERDGWQIRDPLEWLVASLRGGGMMQPAAWLTPREVIERAGPWNESLTLHDDGDFFARVLASASANVFVKEARVIYRDNPEGLSRQRSRQAAQSALAVCRSRHSVIIARRSDPAALTAIATQYAQFAYEFSGSTPDLAAEALHEIERLDAKPDPIIGGRLFRTASRLAGFPTAMRFREMIQGVQRSE